MLEVAQLNAWYGPAHILFDLSFTVAPGQCLALMGRNGAGKTTTLKALMGLLPRCAGAVRFDGHSLRGWPPYRISQAGIGWVPEDRRIFTDLTVRDNLALARQPARAGVPAWNEERVLTLFPPLRGLLRRLGGQLSGGEQQMLTIARTLMGNPRLLLLDEPSEGIAPVLVEQLAQTLAALKQEGLSLLLSEQNPAFAQHVADQVLLLAQGQSRFHGRMTELLAQPALLAECLGV